MNKWLSDEKIALIARGTYDGILFDGENSLGDRLCAQAREANRLRAGLENIKSELERFRNNLIKQIEETPAGYPYCQITEGRAGGYLGAIIKIRKLLEGEK